MISRVFSNTCFYSNILPDTFQIEILVVNTRHYRNISRLLPPQRILTVIHNYKDTVKMLHKLTDKDDSKYFYKHRKNLTSTVS